jgi:hypothetical protein
VSPRIAAVHRQSAFSTQKPSLGSERTSSDFSRATPSTDPSPSRWDAPTHVTIPAVGRAVRHRAAISPGWFVPISTTTARLPSSARNSVCGTPMSLLKESGEPTAAIRVESSSTRTFFVVVFPHEPVIATTGAERRARWNDAIADSAPRGDGWWRTGVSRESSRIQGGGAPPGSGRSSPRGTPIDGRRGEPAAVEVRTGDRDEQIPLAQRARVRAHAACGAARVAARERRAGGLDHVLDRERVHRRSSAATRRSSNSSTRSPIV